MCLRLVKYCWTSLGLLLEERSHGIDCLLREQSIFERTKTCVQITIRNAAPTKTCAYEIHFCGKAVPAKKSSLSFKRPLYQYFCPHFTGVDDFVVPEVQLFSLGRKKLYFFLS